MLPLQAVVSDEVDSEQEERIRHGASCNGVGGRKFLDREFGSGYGGVRGPVRGA